MDFFIKNSDGYICRAMSNPDCSRFLVCFRDRLGHFYSWHIVRYCRGQYKVFCGSSYVPLPITDMFPDWDLRRIRFAEPNTLVYKRSH